ncbi:hypothetical protein HPQ64_09425 [Rhizobiales bacterium]|uniref:hypothetical protein n=1 Tax=Hongsoonwoonella zoysiae TaxID=2821844 RepID=UPI00156154BD|nr:hypothetical protein [Hongsoonwoonella zoysiae]NRG17907.1 hypothetical protein [Hongsoonwoonella zoysiae]
MDFVCPLYIRLISTGNFRHRISTFPDCKKLLFSLLLGIFCLSMAYVNRHRIQGHTVFTPVSQHAAKKGKDTEFALVVTGVTARMHGHDHPPAFAEDAGRKALTPPGVMPRQANDPPRRQTPSCSEIEKSFFQGAFARAPCKMVQPGHTA